MFVIRHKWDRTLINNIQRSFGAGVSVGALAVQRNKPLLNKDNNTPSFTHKGLKLALLAHQTQTRLLQRLVRSNFFT